MPFRAILSFMALRHGMKKSHKPPWSLIGHVCTKNLSETEASNILIQKDRRADFFFFLSIDGFYDTETSSGCGSHFGLCLCSLLILLSNLGLLPRLLP